MANIMDVDDNSVGELSDVPMLCLDYDKNKRWCLICALNAGQPGKQPCECPPEEGAAGLFRSKFEDDKMRVIHQIRKLRDLMEDLMRHYGEKMPSKLFWVIRWIKSEQQLLHIQLHGILQFTNHDDLLHDDGDRELTLQRRGASGKPILAIGIKSIGSWVNFDTDLDAVPSFRELIEVYGDK